jgi:hypothetical protein
MIAEKMANLPNGVRKDRSENSQSYTQQEASERQFVGWNAHASKGIGDVSG